MTWKTATAALFGMLALFVWTATAPAEPSLELVQTIALKGKAGNLDHTALDKKHDRLLVANSPVNALDVVDLKAGTLLKRVRNQQGIQGIAYAPDLDRVFVGLGTGGFCNVFSGDDYKLLKTIKFADDADNVRYDPRTHLVYVAHAEKALGVIDGQSLELKADIALPGSGESFQLDPSRPRLYLNVPSPSQVVLIDTEKNEVAANWPLKLAEANFPMALDAASHRIYIGCRKEPMVVVLDSETGKELGSAAIGKDVDDLYHDAKRKRLYASCGEGFIAVLRQADGDKWELQEKVPTAEGAKTAYFDADTGRYFLVMPKQEGKEGPEIRVYQAKP